MNAPTPRSFLRQLDASTMLRLDPPSREHAGWTLTLSRRRPDGSWCDDTAPGLALDTTQFDRFAAAIVEDMDPSPPVELGAVANYFRDEADRTGDPTKVTIARVLHALTAMLAGAANAGDGKRAARDRQDAFKTQLSSLERCAADAMEKLHGGTWASGSKSLRRAGKPPIAYNEILVALDECLAIDDATYAERVQRANEPGAPDDGTAVGRAKDAFDLIAAPFMIAATNALPEHFPRPTMAGWFAKFDRVSEHLRELHRTLSPNSSGLDPLRTYDRDALLARLLEAAGMSAAAVKELTHHVNQRQSRERNARFGSTDE